MSNTFVRKVEPIIALCRNLRLEEITDVFVSEVTNELDKHDYQSLWLFTDSFILEARNFIVAPDRDIRIAPKAVSYMTCRARDYDFVNATNASRLHVTLGVATREFIFELRASKSNCDYLRDMLGKHIVPALGQLAR
jgi:hypothetical protein